MSFEIPKEPMVAAIGFIGVVAFLYGIYFGIVEFRKDWKRWREKK